MIKNAFVSIVGRNGVDVVFEPASTAESIPTDEETIREIVNKSIDYYIGWF